MKVAQSCLTFCNTMDYRVNGIFQARILEWVAVPFSRGSSQPRDRTRVSCIAGRFFTSWASREAQEYWSELSGMGKSPCMCVHAKSLQLRLILCSPMDCSTPGSPAHGVFQARILEWVAVPFSRGSSQPRDRIQVSCIAGRRFNLWATREAFEGMIIKT